jgi:hypothetical protein
VVRIGMVEDVEVDEEDVVEVEVDEEDVDEVEVVEVNVVEVEVEVVDEDAENIIVMLLLMPA